MTTLASWSVIGSVFRCLSFFPHLPLSPHAVFDSEQWLLGNLASLSSYLHITTTSAEHHAWPLTTIRFDSPEVSHSSVEEGKVYSNQGRGQDEGVISDDVLETYLLHLVSLYSNFDVPGVIQGKKGIMWSKTVRHLSAL